MLFKGCQVIVQVLRCPSVEPNPPTPHEPPALVTGRRIGELSRRVGVSPEVLRAWERRYGLLRPQRSRSGQRLYTELDEARVTRMLGHMDAGYSPAVAARLAVEPGGAPPAPAAAGEPAQAQPPAQAQRPAPVAPPA